MRPSRRRKVRHHTINFQSSSTKSSSKGDFIMKAKVHVTLKRGVLDPQGKAIGHALQSLGFNGVDEVRQGKFIELDLAETDRDAAHKAVESMCQKLLANTVIEDYRIELAD
jgi:phosphoribosylformylglycinamidine synthase subunit PurS